MNVIIVDDEPKAIELLRGYLNFFAPVNVVATFRNGLKAFAYLQREPVDLMLLDINMPHISGLSLARMIPKTTRIIFTTAYSEYGAESYEVNAVDYLLKPISLERFSRAMTKVLNDTNVNPGPADTKPIAVRSGGTVHLLKAEKILYLEKDGNYIHYTLEDRKVMARETMSEALDKLPTDFLRCHKTYAVNLNRVTAFSRRDITLGKQRKVPIGEAYREKVKASLSETTSSGSRPPDRRP